MNNYISKSLQILKKVLFWKTLYPLPKKYPKQTVTDEPAPEKNHKNQKTNSIVK